MRDRAALRVFLVVGRVPAVAARFLAGSVAASLTIGVAMAGGMTAPAAVVAAAGPDGDARTHARGRPQIGEGRRARHGLSPLLGSCLRAFRRRGRACERITNPAQYKECDDGDHQE